MTAISEPPAIMDIMPDSPAIEGVIPESSAIMDVTSRFPVIMHIANEVVKAVSRCKRLVSSLDDAPLMKVHSSGIPAVVPSQEVVPLMTALHITAMAILRVWAAYCSSAQESVSRSASAQ